MDCSTRKLGRRGAGLSCLLGLLFALAPSAPALAYTLEVQDLTYSVSRRDIRVPGGSVRNAETIVNERRQTESVADAGAPVTVLTPAEVGTSVTSRWERGNILIIRLTNAERALCMNRDDFLVTVEHSGRLVGASGGSIDVAAERLRATGGRCPRTITYQLRWRFDLTHATASGAYSAPVTVRVEEGGSVQSLPATVQADLPSALILHRPSRVVLNLQPSAFADLLGGTGSCGGDQCASLPVVSRQLTSLGGPAVVDADISSAAAPVGGTAAITLNDLVASRAIGCIGNRYQSATYQVISANPAVVATSGTLTGIHGQPCGMAAAGGDVELLLRADQLPAGTRRASASILVTVNAL